MTRWLDLGEDDERAVAAFMKRLAALPPPAGLPDPAQLWLKARLLRKWDAERRAQRPLDWMHPIEIVGELLAAGLLLYWSLPFLS